MLRLPAQEVKASCKDGVKDSARVLRIRGVKDSQTKGRRPAVTRTAAKIKPRLRKPRVLRTWRAGVEDTGVKDSGAGSVSLRLLATVCITS